MERALARKQKTEKEGLCDPEPVPMNEEAGRASPTRP